MKEAFQKVTQAYENAKDLVKNKWENFKKKFRETKSEMSQEVMKVETPEDLIALGKKIQQQGEALKSEEEDIKQEETQKGKLEAEKGKMIETDYGEALEEDAARDKKKMDKYHEEAIEEDKAFNETKVAEEEAKRKVELAEQERIRSDILEKLEGTGKNTDIDNKNETKEGIENIYGMNKEDAEELLKSKGYLAEGEIKTSDPKFKEKLEEFHNRRKRYDQVETKLFNRVVSGEAMEEEIKMAEEQVADLAREHGIRGFKFIPKSCYANERLTNAMIKVAGPDDTEWINYVKENYTEEKLKNG